MMLHPSLRNPPPVLFPAMLAAVTTLALPAGWGVLGVTATRQARAAAPLDPPPTTPDSEKSPTETTPPADRPDAEGDAKAAADAPAETPEAKQERETRFANSMTGATLVGRFTVEGKSNGEMPEEEYTILKCEKLPDGDLFRFTARIRYGETNLELPMDLPVYWAGDTPVISLTNLWIPGLGTFSSRVMIYRGQYAGTWKHGEAGGHMFGVIKREE